MRPTPIAPSPIRTPRSRLRVATIQLVMLSGAIAVIQLQTPRVITLAALAVLTLVPGYALIRLVLGETSPRPLLADAAIRLPLTVVFGVVTLLAVTFILDIAGVPIRTTTVAVGVALSGAALVLGAAMRRLPRYGPSPRALTRPFLGAVAAASVLAAAVAAAIWLQPKNNESFTTITFADESWLTQPNQPVAAAAPVRINWIMRSFGYLPDPEATGVEVMIDGSPLTSIGLDFDEPTVPAGPDQPAQMGGAVTFAAPATPGEHLVSVTVYPRAVNALEERQPVMLTGRLKVSPS